LETEKLEDCPREWEREEVKYQRRKTGGIAKRFEKRGYTTPHW